MPNWKPTGSLPLAAPVLKGSATILLDSWTTQVRTTSGGDSTTRLVLPAQDSVADIIRIGMNQLSSTEPGAGWAAVLDVLMRIPGVPGKKSKPALCRIRSVRISRKADVFLGNVWSNRRANEQLFQDLDSAFQECSKRMESELKGKIGSDFPDRVFVDQVSRMLREAEWDSGNFSAPPGYSEFRDQLLGIATDHPDRASRELLNAQKSKDLNRRLYAKCLMLDATDLMNVCYVGGMTLVRGLLTKQALLNDAASRGLYRFLHEAHEYLDGIVPALHSICELMLHSDSFLTAAVSRFEAKPVTLKAQADFYGAIQAVVGVYRSRVMQNRDWDREKKSRGR